MYDYHRDFTRVSKSMLDVYLTSPQEYYLHFVSQELDPPAPKKAMLIGDAVHKILLDRLSAKEILAIYTDDCFKHDKAGRQVALNPNTAEQFRQQHSTRICLKQEDAATVLACVEAVRNHPLGELLLFPEARFEEVQHWNCPHSGLDCRMRGDMVIATEDGVYCYDLKTTALPAPNDFQRVAKRFRYWLQEQHYSSGLRTIFGRPVKFKFWAIETKFPFRIAPYEFDAHSSDECLGQYADAMIRLAVAYEKQEWQDPWTTSLNYLAVNTWDFETPELVLDDSGVDDGV